MRSFLGKIGILLLVTLIMLELLAQIVWWQSDCIQLAEKDLCLLPFPLLTDSQIRTLDQFEKSEAGKDNYLQFDSVLGWSIRPNGQGQNLYRANSIGARGLRDYSPEPLPGITRLAVFGPSFAHADEVTNEETWTHQIEQSQPGWEVINWGVPGYGTDQALLRYEVQGAAFDPQIVIIAFEEENLRRNVNRYRPFVFRPTGVPLTKPVFVAEGIDLNLIDNPFDSVANLRHKAMDAPNRFLDLVCPHDHFCVRAVYKTSPLDLLKSYRFLRTLSFEINHQGEIPSNSYGGWRKSYDDPIQVETTLKLLQHFAEKVRQNGATPVVVVFSYQSTVEEISAGRSPIYQQIITSLELDGLHVIDIASAMVEAKPGTTDFSSMYARWGHYSPAGNQLVSQTIIDYLCNQNMAETCSSTD